MEKRNLAEKLSGRVFCGLADLSNSAFSYAPVTLALWTLERAPGWEYEQEISNQKAAKKVKKERIMRGNNGGIIDGIWREDWTYLHLSVHIHAHRIDWLYIVIVSSLKFLFHKFIIKHCTGWTERCLQHNWPGNCEFCLLIIWCDEQHQWFFLVNKICHQAVIIMSICTKDKKSQ